MKYALLLCCLSASLACAENFNPPALIPLPQHMQKREGEFILKPTARIVAGAGSRETADYLASRLRPATGYALAVVANGEKAGDISLTTNGANQSLGEEGYELTVAPQSVVIRAPEAGGLFYGAQSLLQMLPPEAFGTKQVTGVKWKMACARIEDQPRFRWRGFMMDVSRHFFSKQEIKRVVDVMPLYKLNTFHWHLVDDQGWRIEIKKYPRLTEVGAWRKGIGFGLAPAESAAYGADGRYGGFYTQDDIREIVAYARARHIIIVPEIEMPGHSTAALAAYPQYSCKGGPFNLDVNGGIFDGIYCAGNEQTFAFIEDILTEVMGLFPDPFIHVGGDEVKKDTWKKCPKCQERMRQEGIKSEAGLQSYFIHRVEKIIAAHGHRLIGWSEIREGGLAPSAAIMAWRGGAVEAASAGCDVVMAPTGFCYLDYYQSTNHATEPRAIGGYLPLSQVYALEPEPDGLNAVGRTHILGTQCNLWTEYIPSLKRVQYMMFPRLCALAEVAWSPQSSRNWKDFQERLEVNAQRLDALDIAYRPNRP